MYISTWLKMSMVSKVTVKCSYRDGGRHYSGSESSGSIAKPTALLEYLYLLNPQDRSVRAPKARCEIGSSADYSLQRLLSIGRRPIVAQCTLDVLQTRIVRICVFHSCTPIIKAIMKRQMREADAAEVWTKVLTHCLSRQEVDVLYVIILGFVLRKIKSPTYVLLDYNIVVTRLQ